MCGIVGFYCPNRQRSPEENHRVATAMHEAISHRGPDDAGIWEDENCPITLAHRRLSIIDLSNNGHQPMESPSGRYVISYNGEIYNFPELRERLIGLGHQFIGSSDTETLITAIEYWGIEDAIKQLNGMFAFAVWDKNQRILHLVRDRLGKKPLYYGWAGDNIVFASELKSFHQFPDFPAEIDRDILASFLQYRYVQAPYSIFKNVWQLQPGAHIALTLESLSPGENLLEKQRFYWRLPDVMDEARRHPNQQSEAEILRAFEGHLRKAVEMRMISDVPLGAFLSGGIDSSLIVAMMCEVSPNPPKTFCIGFNEEQYDESSHARDIAEHLGTDHHEFIITGKDALDVIPALAKIYDEPFGDPSQIPTYLVSKFAREQVTVVLTGDGGDELLGGYERHFLIPDVLGKFSKYPLPLRQALGGVLQMAPYKALNSMLPGKQQLLRRMRRAAHMLPLNDHQKIYAKLMSSWPQPERFVIGAKKRLMPIEDAQWVPQGLSLSEHIIFSDALSYRADDIMVKVDRAGMAHSLEARAPLMDYRLSEYCFSLPAAMSVRGKSGKWLLKELLSQKVPRSLWDRSKKGFSVPVNDWLRGPLKEWANALLDEELLKRQGYFDAAPIRAAWRRHLEGYDHETTGAHLWNVLTFQSWLEEWKPGA